MKVRKSSFGVFVSLLVALWSTSIGLQAQTATTATILGTLTDPSEAVVVGAQISLTEILTQQTRSTLSNEAGQYTFASVPPGLYRLTVLMSGFRQAAVEDLRVDVAKSYLVDFRLEVGEVAQTLEVEATVGAELQTLDSTVGVTLKGDAMRTLPAINRSASALVALQPLVASSRTMVNISNYFTGGSVAGSRSDQNSFYLDGADATDQGSGNSYYFSAATDWSGPTPVVPVPLESVEEFRVATTNPNATFGRSSGGQISFVTRRGTNALHGSAYWYHQNDNLNSNLWTFNRLGIRKPELKDNRFGASLGGPLIKDRLFLFGHYEGRRFPKTDTVTRLVPTRELRQGVLRFFDAAGNVNSYRLIDYDPRRLGLNPLISRLWTMFPEGNDPSAGDGLNTAGYTGPADASLGMNFGVARLDYQRSSNWRFTSTYRYASQEVKDTSQVDFAGLTAGRPGEIQTGGLTPAEPRFFTAQVSGAIRPALINETTFGYVRNYWAYRRIDPFPQVPGTAAALMVTLRPAGGAAGTLDSGIDVDPTRARSRQWREHTWQVSDNLTWIKGKRALHLGGSIRFMPIFFVRQDKVVGPMTTPLYELHASNATSITSSARPPTCAMGASGNCLRPGDVQRWNELFAAALGIVDTAGVIVVRDADLKPLPLGTPIRLEANDNLYEGYASQVWRATPSLTFTTGLLYSVRTPRVDRNGFSTLMIDAATKEILDTRTYLGRRRAAAERGEVYNPTLGWLPIRQSGRKYPYELDWSNLGPRLAAAWSPSFGEGLLGRVFGSRKTVLRGGYSETFGSSSNLGGASTGFSQTATCSGPRTDGACPGSNNEGNAFRIGIDGSAAPIPTLGPASAPVVLGMAGEAISFSNDPKMKVERTHGVNFSIQRQLSRNYLAEAGYVRRWSNNLILGNQLNAVPYMMRDAASGQTFAQAYDAVAQQLRAGVSPVGVTPQPWFENQLRGSPGCGASCTQLLAARLTAAFQQGQLNNLMNFINTQRPGGPIYNQQAIDLWVRTSDSRFHYDAGFLSLTRRFSQGLSFTANYTFSRTLDQNGAGQNGIAFASTPYDLNVDYGPALWDRPHVFNSFWYYELPFGQGKRFRGSSGAFDRAFGGWSISGIFTASSGIPLTVQQHPQVFGGSQLFTSSFFIPGVLPARPGIDYSSAANQNVRGSGGVGVTGNPVRRGSGVNLFADPEEVYRSLRPILVSQDGRQGRGIIRGLKRWNWDVSVRKTTSITEQLRVAFVADFINALNHLELADPVLNYQNPAAFGVLTDQFSNPRQIQLGLRFEW